MQSSEDRLLALTYIKSSIDEDNFQKAAILKELGPDALIDALTEISKIIAGALALSIDPENPTPTKQVLEDLRTITHEE
jgi:hypothetical protein